MWYQLPVKNQGIASWPDSPDSKGKDYVPGNIGRLDGDLCVLFIPVMKKSGISRLGGKEVQIFLAKVQS